MLVCDDSHAEILHWLKALAEAGVAGMPYYRAVVCMWKNQCVA